MPSAVCDAGPLIHLAEIAQLPLLNQFSPLWIPESVLREAGIATTQLPRTAKKMEVLPADRQRLPTSSRTKLHTGETDCLAICLKYPSAIFLTDDLDARDLAKKLRIEPHGSVGIVALAHQTGVC